MVVLCAMTQVRLTSSAVPDDKDDTTVVIGPPFYLSAKFAGKELPIQVRPSPALPLHFATVQAPRSSSLACIPTLAVRLCCAVVHWESTRKHTACDSGLQL